ncbi:MAG: glycoside hydrolase family 2 TIM barrel-domain containing protein [Phycisphaerales bacterium]
MNDRSVRWCFRVGVLFAVAASVTVACARAAEPAGHCWMEGENPTHASQKVSGAGAGHAEWLSDGKWLLVSIEAGKVDKEVPEDGIVLTYDFTTNAAGTYEIWNRIGFEFVRSAFDWRIDGGEWKRIEPTDLTTDCMALSRWTEVAWLEMGEADLAAGRHQLQIRLPKLKNAKGQFERVLYASDALCVYRGKFAPNSKFKPGEDYRTDADRQAAEHVFVMPAPVKSQDRVALPLNGQWEVCRDDEQNPPADIAVPMQRMNEQAAWSAIAVPSDRNKSRPDLLFAHRLWYRTRVNVPAGYAGRSMFVTFPLNSLNTTVYVNGQLCGFGKNPLARFDVDVSKAIKPGQVNEILVGIRDAWYGYQTDPKNPMMLRKVFNTPPEYFHQGWQRLVYPIWGRSESGILDTPTLTAAGPVYAGDVFVKPLVADKRLAAEVTLTNPTDAAVAGQVVCEAVDPTDGKVAVTLPAGAFSLEAGATQTVEIAGLWTDAKLWWPDAPNLYDLRVTVRTGEKVLDVSDTRFGYRQWTMDGTDFKLNGVKYRAWADCFSVSGKDAWLDFYHKTHQTMMRFWGIHWGPATDMSPNQVLDWSDAHGVVVRRTGILDGELMSYQPLPELAGHWKDQVVAWVRGERNHPSIMIWSLENEFQFVNIINMGQCDKWEPVTKEVAAAVEKVDPTRPLMIDGGGALKDNSLPVHGDHYTTGPITEYPNLAYEANTKGGGRNRWEWDQKRPRFIGEEIFLAGNHPELSYLGGESVFIGKTGNLPAAGLWARILTEGYRWFGVGGFHYWMGHTDTDGSFYNSFSHRAVFCRQWDWSFGSGQKITRTFGIFNDTHSNDPITFTWKLAIGDQVVASNTTEHAVPAGENEKFNVELTLPATKQRLEGTLSLDLSVKGRPVYHDVKQVSVLPTADDQPLPAGLAALKAKDLLVYDPNNSVIPFLQQRHIAFTALNDIATLPDAGRILLIGTDAIHVADSTSSKFAAYVATGRRLIVLDQKNPLKFQALPAVIDAAVNTGQVAFGENMDHPLLAGLRQKDFFTWGHDALVYRNAYQQPQSGAKSLVQCHDQLNYSALIEVPVNDGLMLLNQLLVGEKLADCAPARQVMLNLLNHAATYKLFHRPVAAVAADLPTLSAALDGMGLQYSPVTDPLAAISSDKTGIVVMSASPANLKILAENLPKLHAFTQAGGWIIFNNLTPDGLADYNKIVGVEHMIRPFKRQRITFPPVRNSLSAGLTSRDIVLYTSKRIFGFRDGNYTVGDQFSFIVDLEEVAPFAKSSFHAYDNIVNGFVGADGWPLIIDFPIPQDGKPFNIQLDFPVPQTLTQYTHIASMNYNPTTRVNLIFDGDEADKLPLTLQPDGSEQTFDINPPRPAKHLTIQIAGWQLEPGKPLNIGIDNIYIKVQRSPEFHEKVKPMLNIGGLVSYPQGAGGIVLCNLLFKGNEEVPENLLKKRRILAVILDNLHAPFAGGKTIIAGANLNYQPIDISQSATAYRDDKGWFGDKNFTFRELPTGRHTFAGVPFDVYEFATSPVPTVVMLAGKDVPGNLPAEVKAIVVNRKADAMFFLQAARIDRKRNADDLKKNRAFELCRYVVHYADGKQEVVPIFAELDIESYKQATPRPVPGAQIAWTRPYETGNVSAVAYSKQWNNPRPDVAITTIDLLPGKDNAGVPALLALTAASTQ